MAAHSYSLRSRVSSSSLSARTPTQSPASKTKSPRKQSVLAPTLQLKNVIGTTTSAPGGLSTCPAISSYAYCAGSVAVVVHIDKNNAASYRYYKARPTALPINQITSCYDSPSNPSTPTRKRTSLHVRPSYGDHSRSSSNRDWIDDSVGQTWSARERIKTASCVSMSPDGKILAVGETGYNPRVLLFSLAANMPTDTPLSILTDHTIGVRCVAFSSDSKFLATLGDVNDGFLYIWQINTKTGSVRLHSSNKCTTNVCDMTWCGNNVVTVGTRHIKIWHASEDNKMPQSPRTRIRREGDASSPNRTPLLGRNCLLGPFVDATFTAIVAVSNDQAVVCADDGHICLVNLGNGRGELTIIEKIENTVAAVSCCSNPLRLVWAGGGGGLEERYLSEIQGYSQHSKTDQRGHNVRGRTRMSRESLLRHSLGLSPPKRANVVALSCLDDRAVSIDADGVLRILNIDTHDLEPDILRMASHNGLVRGVQTIPTNSSLGSFLTWARSGEIRFWNTNGALIRVETIDLDQNLDSDETIANELKVVRYIPSDHLLVVGDQFGILKVIDCESWKCIQTIRAHSAEINCIVAQEPDSLLATCSRDRMVQVLMLRGNRLELLQTSDDHISSVNQILFNQDGSRLLSCSNDRTVVVRDRVKRKVGSEDLTAFIPTRTITLKTGPLSMSFIPTQINMLAISTMDRHVLKIDAATGITVGSFKVSDPDTDDTVMLNSISLGDSKMLNGQYVLAGYSAIDKSIRIYDFEKGILLGRDSGHTEGITDITVVENDTADNVYASMTVVSTGMDGTIMIWSANCQGQPLLSPQNELSAMSALRTDPEKMLKASPASLPPLRKILSKMDIAEFSRQSSPTRESSPNGLRRKTSRLALTTSIDEVDENAVSEALYKSQDRRADVEKRSPSPPQQQAGKLRKQRSQLDLGKEADRKQSNLRRSPSPSATPNCISLASQHTTRANNCKLRRPPSMPNDLRSQSIAQGRRQSVSSANDFGSFGMATEQASRMLRTYRKRLQASRGDVDLDDIEVELEIVLQAVRQKKASMESKSSMVRALNTYTDGEINELSSMMERTTFS